MKNSITFPEMPGIETEHALMMLGNNSELLFRLMLKFPANHGSTTNQILLALENGDRETAYRLVHSLKSVAGSIGAYELQEKAGAVAKTIKDQQDISTVLVEMEASLQTVLNSIEKLKS